MLDKNRVTRFSSQLINVCTMAMLLLFTGQVNATSGDNPEVNIGTSVSGSHCWPYLTTGRNMEGYTKDNDVAYWVKVESTFWKKENGSWTNYGTYSDLDSKDALVAISRFGPSGSTFYINSKHWRYDVNTLAYIYLTTTTIAPCS